MFVIIVKIIVVLVAFVSISKSYIDYRKRQESQTMFLFWACVWTLSAAIIVYPPLIDAVIKATKGQTVTIGSLTGLAFIFMLYIVYRVYTKASRIEYQQTELIRKLGLRKAKSKDGA